MLMVARLWVSLTTRPCTMGSLSLDFVFFGGGHGRVEEEAVVVEEGEGD